MCCSTSFEQFRFSMWEESDPTARCGCCTRLVDWMRLVLRVGADCDLDSLPESPLNQLIAAAAFVSLEEEEVSAFLSRLGSQFDLYMSDRANFAV